MTAIGRAGLLIADDSSAATISDILSDADFEVERISAPKDILHDTTVAGLYDILIVDSASTRFMEEAIFSLILSVRGFLLLDSAGHLDGLLNSSMRYISIDMSPEEIVTRANSVLFQDREIRRSPRISVDISVGYSCGAKICRSSLTSLSHNGGFIATLNPQEINAQVKVEFVLPGCNRMIHASGRVLYRIGYDLEQAIILHPNSSEKKITALPGMGIYFDTISDSDREAIRKFIEERIF